MAARKPAREVAPLSPLGASTSRSDLVVEAIRAAVLNGTLKQGELLVERRLAELLGVSKTPVREALIVLSRTGLVQTTRNRGVSIRKLSVVEAQHVYEERLLLEPWAVGAAVRDDADFSAARAITSQLKKVRRASDLVGLAMQNRQFHRAIYSGCPNAFVVEALDGLQDLTTLATVDLVWDRNESWRRERDEHARILDACLDGDATAAYDLMHEHISASLARIKAGFAERD
jgi:DNA-binding GntR family transcriptional regulator